MPLHVRDAGAEGSKVQNMKELAALSMKESAAFFAPSEEATCEILKQEHGPQFPSGRTQRLDCRLRSRPSECGQLGGQFPLSQQEFNPGISFVYLRDPEETAEGGAEDLQRASRRSQRIAPPARAMDSGGWERFGSGREGRLRTEKRRKALLRRISSTRGGMACHSVVRTIGGRLHILKHRSPVYPCDPSMLSARQRLRLTLLASSGKMQREYRQWKKQAGPRACAFREQMKQQARVHGRRAGTALRGMQGELMRSSKKQLAILKQHGRVYAPRAKTWALVKTKVLGTRVKVAGKAGLQRCISLFPRSGETQGPPKDNEGIAQHQANASEQAHGLRVSSSDDLLMSGNLFRPPAVPQGFLPGMQPSAEQRGFSMETLRAPPVFDHCGTRRFSILREISEQSTGEIQQKSRSTLEHPSANTQLFQPLMCHSAEAACASVEMASAPYGDSRGASATEGLQRVAGVDQTNEAVSTTQLQLLPLAGSQQESRPSLTNQSLEQDGAVPPQSVKRNGFEQVLKTWQSKEMQVVAQRKRGSNTAREPTQSSTQGLLHSTSKSSKELGGRAGDFSMEETAPVAELGTDQPSQGICERSNIEDKVIEQEQGPPPLSEKKQGSTSLVEQEEGSISLIEQEQASPSFIEEDQGQPSLETSPSQAGESVVGQCPTNPFTSGQLEAEESNTPEESPKEAASSVSRKGSDAVMKTVHLCARAGTGAEELVKGGTEQTHAPPKEPEGTRVVCKGLWMLPTKWEVFGLLLGALFVYVLIFLCNKAVPKALLLLFCCLFGLRIRLGGSGSKGGGSYTAMCLLLLQLLVIISLCIVSLTKQVQDPDKLAEQLKESQLYTADIRITGTLLFVAVVFAVFTTGFLTLGHLGFNSFYSFVFQPLELCIYGAEELRSCNIGVLLASAICLCMADYQKCGGLIIFLTLVLAFGRLLINSLSRSKLETAEEGAANRRSRRLFFVGIVIQAVALIGTMVMLCCAPHKLPDPLKKRVSQAAFGVAFLATLSEILVLIAQVVAYKLSSRWTTPCQQAFILAAGGHFENPAPHIYLAGRHNVHYDVEACLYSSTYSYFIVVQRYAGEVFWVHRLVTFKAPLPKALRDQQHLQKKLQELPLKAAASTPSWSGAGGSASTKGPLLLPLHSKALVHEASGALDVTTLQHLQTVALASLLSADRVCKAGAPAPQQPQTDHYFSPPVGWRNNTVALSTIEELGSSAAPLLNKEMEGRASPKGPEGHTKENIPICNSTVLKTGSQDFSGLSSKAESNVDLLRRISRRRSLSEETDSSRIDGPAVRRKSSKAKSGKQSPAARKKKKPSTSSQKTQPVGRRSRSSNARESEESGLEEDKRKQHKRGETITAEVALSTVMEVPPGEAVPDTSASAAAAPTETVVPAMAETAADERAAAAQSTPPDKPAKDVLHARPGRGNASPVSLEAAKSGAGSGDGTVDASAVLPFAAAEPGAAAATAPGGEPPAVAAPLADDGKVLFQGLAQMLLRLQQEQPQLLQDAPCFSRRLQEEGEKVLEELLQRRPACREDLLSLHHICSGGAEELPQDLQIAAVLQFVRTVDEEYRLPEQEKEEEQQQQQENQQKPEKEQREEELPVETQEEQKQDQQQQPAEQDQLGQKPEKQQQEREQLQPKQQNGQELHDQKHEAQQQQQKVQEEQEQKEGKEQQKEDVQPEKEQQQKQQREEVGTDGSDISPLVSPDAAGGADNSVADGSQIEATGPDSSFRAPSADSPAAATVTVAESPVAEPQASVISVPAESSAAGSPAEAAAASAIEAQSRGANGLQSPEAAIGAPLQPAIEEIRKALLAATDTAAPKPVTVQESAASDAFRAPPAPEATQPNAKQNAAAPTGAAAPGGFPLSSSYESLAVGSAIPLPPEHELSEVMSPLGSRGSLGGPLGAPLITEEEAEQIEERLLQQVAEQQQAVAWGTSSLFFPPSIHGGLDDFLSEAEKEAAAGAGGTRGSQSDGEDEAEAVFSVFLSRRRRGPQAGTGRSASASPGSPFSHFPAAHLSRTSPPIPSNRHLPHVQQVDQQQQEPLTVARPPSLHHQDEWSDEGYSSAGRISIDGPYSSMRPSAQSTRPSAGSNSGGPTSAAEGTNPGPSPSPPPSYYDSPQLPLLQQRRGAVAGYYEGTAPAAGAPTGRRYEERPLSSTSYTTAEAVGLVNPRGAPEGLSASALPRLSAVAPTTVRGDALPLRRASASGASDASRVPPASMGYPLPQILESCSGSGDSSHAEVPQRRPQRPLGASDFQYLSRYPLSPSTSWRRPEAQQSGVSSSSANPLATPAPRQAISTRDYSARGRSISSRPIRDHTEELQRGFAGDSRKNLSNLRGPPNRVATRSLSRSPSGFRDAAAGRRGSINLFEQGSQEEGSLKRDQETQVLMGSRSRRQSERTKDRALQERFERLKRQEEREQLNLHQQMQQQQQLKMLQSGGHRNQLTSMRSRGESNESSQQVQHQQPSRAPFAVDSLNQHSFESEGTPFSPYEWRQNGPDATVKEPPRSSRALRSFQQQQEQQHQSQTSEDQEDTAREDVKRLLQRQREVARLQQQRQLQLALLQQQQREFIAECQLERNRKNLTSQALASPHDTRLSPQEEKGGAQKRVVPQDPYRETPPADNGNDFVFAPETIRIDGSLAEPVGAQQRPALKSHQPARRASVRAPPPPAAAERHPSRLRYQQETPEESHSSAASSRAHSLVDDKESQGPPAARRDPSPLWGVFGLSGEPEKTLRDPDLDGLAARLPVAVVAAADLATAGTEGTCGVPRTAESHFLLERGPDGTKRHSHSPQATPNGTAAFLGTRNVSIRGKCTPHIGGAETPMRRDSMGIVSPKKAGEMTPQKGTTTADAAVEADLSIETPVPEVFGFGDEERDSSREEEAPEGKKQHSNTTRNSGAALGCTNSTSGLSASPGSSDVFGLPPEAEQQQQEWCDQAKAAEEGRHQIAEAAAAAAAAASAARAAAAAACDVAKGRPVEVFTPPQLHRAIESFQMEEGIPPLPSPREYDRSAPRSCSGDKGRHCSSSGASKQPAKREASPSSGAASGQEDDDGRRLSTARNSRSVSPSHKGHRSGSRGHQTATHQQHGKPRGSDVHPGPSKDTHRDPGASHPTNKGRSNKRAGEGTRYVSESSAGGDSGLSRDVSQAPWALGAPDGDVPPLSPQMVEKYYMRERRGSMTTTSGGVPIWTKDDGSYLYRPRRGSSLSRRGSRLDFSGAPAAARAIAAKLKDRLKPLLSRNEQTSRPGVSYVERAPQPISYHLGNHPYAAAPATPEFSAHVGSQIPPVHELPTLIRAKEQREVNRKRSQRPRFDEHDEIA